MKQSTKILLSLVLLGLAVLERLYFDLGANIELITALTVAVGLYMGGWWAIILPLLAIWSTDRVMGNTSIFLFTWSAYALAGAILPRLGQAINFSSSKLVKKIVWSAGLGLGFSVWFFVWTNFGFWWLEQWDLYPNNLSGLIMAYQAGLPFLKYNLLGNLILVPAAVGSYELVQALSWQQNMVET